MNYGVEEELICNEECRNGVLGCPYLSCPKEKEKNPTI